jgi:hypothetical protein
MSFMELYFAWAGSNVITALAGAAVTWGLFSLTALGGNGVRTFAHLILVVGAAVLPIIAISVLAALVGIQPFTAPGLLGIIAGVVAGYRIRSKAQPPSTA